MDKKKETDESNLIKYHNVSYLGIRTHCCCTQTHRQMRVILRNITLFLTLTFVHIAVVSKLGDFAWVVGVPLVTLPNAPGVAHLAVSCGHVI